LLRDAEFASMKFAPQFYLSGFVKQILKPRNLRPVAPPKRNFPQRAGAKGNRKIPWSVLLFGLHAMASDPPRMLTQSGNDCQRLAAIFLDLPVPRGAGNWADGHAAQYSQADLSPS